MTNSTMWDSDFTLVSGSCGCGWTMSQATPRKQKASQDVTNLTQRLARDEGNKRAWNHEIDRKINEYKGTFEHFLDDFAPREETYKRCEGSMENIFDSLLAKETVALEKYMYTPLVSGLNKLCESMPQKKKLAFVDTHTSRFEPPFPRWMHSHTYSSPDIVALLPGKTTTKNYLSNVWENVSLVVEAKNINHPDPIESTSKDATTTRIQLAKNANKLMLAHGSLCCFTIGIYGRKARIFRFDHATAVASPAFDYCTTPELMRKFLWRFVHSEVGPFLGVDDCRREATPEDIQWAKDVNPSLQDGDFDNSRWVVLPASDNHPEESYLMLRVLSLNSLLFSRSTMVRGVLKKGDASGKMMILKRAWRQIVRTNEGIFYHRIQEYAKRTNQELFGVARMVRACDLGERRGDDVSNFHFTRSSAHRPSEQSDLGERSDMCFIIDTVGLPLSEFKRTRTLVGAIRDAIKGHQLAYKAGVLHRDVSNGNVMIAVDEPFEGFIHDFDYSSLIDSSEDGGTALSAKEVEERDEVDTDLKERTGTFHFLAIGLLDLEGRPVIHQVHHDLESFYWLLIWVVLRHTRHNHPKGVRAWEGLFDKESEEEARSSKLSWISLVFDPIEVADNVPLTQLLYKLTELMYPTLKRPGNNEVKPLTYDSVLSVFDEALRKDSWPEADASIPFGPSRSTPDSPTKKIKPSTKRARAEDVEQDNTRVSKKVKQWPSEFGWDAAV